MRFLHFGPPTTPANGPLCLLEGLSKLGHKLESCNLIQVEGIKEKASKAIAEFKPDMVITVGGWFANYDAPELWEVIRNSSLPHIYWAIEDPIFFDWASSVHIDAYDFVFTISEECVSKYIDLGVPAAYLPLACNPDFHFHTSADPKYTNDIIVLSNKVVEYDPQRCAFRNECYRRIIEPVLQGAYDIKIYGSGWDGFVPEKNLGGYVFRDLAPIVYSSAKIVLMTQWDLDGHICFKTYEAMACACFQIAPYTPLQENHFKDGEHIVYSRSPEETIEYVDYYLSHDKERELIAKRAQEEVYKNHNCTLRFRKAMEILRSHGFYIDFIEK